MKDKMVEKLTTFGLSVNQARIYMSILRQKATHVGNISKDTGVHRQDVYKILPKLEKMGLIVKSLVKPYLIIAIPPEKALMELVMKERKTLSERIDALVESAAILEEEIKGACGERTEKAVEVFVIEGEALYNRAQAIVQNLRAEYDLVASFENLLKKESDVSFLAKQYKKLANLGIKTRILLTTKNQDEDLMNGLIEKLIPRKGNFQVKSIDDESTSSFAVLDFKEVYIFLKTQGGTPANIITNSEEVVGTFQNLFDNLWDNPRAKAIYPKRALSPRQPSVTSVSLCC